MIHTPEIPYVLSRLNDAPAQRRKLSCIIKLAMHPVAMYALLALQIFSVPFLVLHDWISLGSFNSLAGVRAANPGAKLLTTTLVSAAPYAFGLAASIVYFGSP